MSDSASKKDVEDVLTSVRRLVSGELPRNRRPNLPEGPGALVLTDAQRVERSASKGNAAKTLEDRIAELEAAVSSRADEYEPDGSEDQAQHRPDRIVYTRPPAEEESMAARGHALRLGRLSLVRPKTSDDNGEIVGDDASEAPFRHEPSTPGRSPAAEAASPAPEKEAPMAEDVAIPPRERAEVHRFHSPDEMMDRLERRLTGGDIPTPGIGHNGFADRLEPYDSDAAEDMQGDAVPEFRHEAQGSEAGDPLDTLEDDEDPADDDDFESALTEAVTDSLGSSGQVGEIAPALSEVGAAAIPAGAFPAAARAAIDEETLRPIVAKLIREELQGELGERITRNVRKLVRREIQRMLASREFE